MSLLEDARNIQRKDPAARSVLEVILLYPGFHILVYHRIAHWLYEHGHFFLARWVSQHGRHKTGIEIHPGARIGRCLFIDHGMGINNKTVNPADDLDQQDLPDVMAQRLTELDRRISRLEKDAQGDVPPSIHEVIQKQRPH